MSNIASKKVFIQVETAEEQQEHLKNHRKTLKVLQSGATDKENLAGRPLVDKLIRIKAATETTLASTEYSKRKKIESRSVETQTKAESHSKEITVKELTSNEPPSEVYWEKLAEKRRLALDESLKENQSLHERIEGLEEELNTSRQMLEEARNLVDVLTEMLNENEAEREIENELSATAEADKGDDKDDSESGKEESFKTP